MIKKKVIILVLSADIAGYDNLIKSIRDTWGAKKLDDYEILYYYGYKNDCPRPPLNTTIQIGDTIICGCEESIPNVNIKNYLAFKHIYENYDFDYIFRCCAGSYINQTKLNNFLQDKPLQRFYCGIIAQLHTLRFISGSGFFISRDVVNFLINNPQSFVCHGCDDVAIGKYLADAGIPLTLGNRYDVINVADVKTLDHYHFHLPYVILRDQTQRHNTSVMYEIHKILTER